MAFSTDCKENFVQFASKGAFFRRIKNRRYKNRMKIFTRDEQILVEKKNFGCESAAEKQTSKKHTHQNKPYVKQAY